MALCGPPIKHPVLAANNTPGPPTGIAACCARAASGHAAAPPSSDSNARRFNHSGTSRRKALVTLRLREIRE